MPKQLQRRPSGDAKKAERTAGEIKLLELLIGRERDKFRRSELKQEMSWHRRRLIFYQGGRAR